MDILWMVGEILLPPCSLSLVKIFQKGYKAHSMVFLKNPKFVLWPGNNKGNKANCFQQEFVEYSPGKTSLQ